MPKLLIAPGSKQSTPTLGCWAEKSLSLGFIHIRQNKGAPTALISRTDGKVRCKVLRKAAQDRQTLEMGPAVGKQLQPFTEQELSQTSQEAKN